jgi:hypothetical protein
MILLIDEMWPPDAAEQLRRRDRSAISVHERADLRRRDDVLIFAVAQAEGLTIVTENVPDFRPFVAAVLQEGSSFPGIIYTTDHRFPRGNPRTVGRLITALDLLLSRQIDLTNVEHWLE